MLPKTVQCKLLSQVRFKNKQKQMHVRWQCEASVMQTIEQGLHEGEGWQCEVKMIQQLWKMTSEISGCVVWTG